VPGLLTWDIPDATNLRTVPRAAAGLEI